MIRTSFIPSRHGFHFPNAFENFTGFGGRCGGMAMAALDYYSHGLPVPTHGPDDFGAGRRVPPDGSRLSNYIYDRLLASLSPVHDWGGLHFVTADTNLDNHYGWSVNDEFPRIKRKIDAGQPFVLGIRPRVSEPWNGHQVVAYGYDEGPARVYIYDNNYPDQEVMLLADETNRRILHVYVDGTPTGHPTGHYEAFASYFVHDVFFPDVYPPYVDLGVQSGLTFSAPVGDGLRQVGERLEIEAVVRNFGDSPAHIQLLLIWARDPNGWNRDADFGCTDGTTTIHPGQEIRLHRTIDSFGEGPGTYRFGIGYLSEQNHWIEVPALGPQARTTASIELVPGVDAGVSYGTGGYTGPGTYFIRARHSGKVLDVNIDWFQGQNNGQPVYQHDLNNGDNQKFIVEPLPGGYVRISPKHSRASNKYLDVAGVSSENGAGLQQWDWWGGDNQQFAIEPVGDHYRVRARHSGLFWDIAGVSLENRARLTQWAWWGGDNQLFQFVPTN